MNAINLVPADQRRRGVTSRSGGGVYVLIGTLAVLVVLAAAYALTARSIVDKKAQLATVTAQADQAEARAGDLKRYTEFATLRARRVETVRNLAQARFDWAHVLSEVARTVPANASLSSLNGTTGAASASSAGPGAPPGAPSVAVAGCTSSQDRVAELMVNLRRIDGVAGVSLASSGAEAAGSSPSGSTGSGGTPSAGCATSFSINLAFAPPAAQAPAATNGSTP